MQPLETMTPTCPTHTRPQQVVEAATEDYPEVQDLLKRFTTLKEANKNLNEAQARDEGETERLRSGFSSYTKERQATNH